MRWWEINRVCCVASRYIVSSLLIANGLMTKEEFEEEFESVKGNKLYDDIDWVYELVELFKDKYEGKRKLIEK